MSGKNASPSAKPKVAMDSALPRAATNQRAMATTARWLSMPCPVNRNAKITSGNSHQTGLTAMKRHAPTISTRTSGARRRTRKRSVSPPAQTITSADAVVPSI